MISTGYREYGNHGWRRRSQAPRFSSAVEKNIAARAVPEIRNLNVAQKLYRVFNTKFWTHDPRIGGLSMEDVAGRGLNLLGITIPQGVVAIWTDTSPWERNVQNVLTLGLGIGLGILFKNNRIGLNSLLDPLMKPLPNNASKLRKTLMKPFHPEVNYFDILKAAGVGFKPKDRKRAFWANMDSNQRALIDALERNLAQKEAAGRLTEPAEKAILKALPGFRRRLIGLPFFTAGLIMLTTIYVLGYLTTKFVFKVFVPLDEAREKAKEAKQKNLQCTPPANGTLPDPPPPISPKSFGSSLASIPSLPCYPGFIQPLPSFPSISNNTAELFANRTIPMKEAPHVYR